MLLSMIARKVVRTLSDREQKTMKGGDTDVVIAEDLTI